MSKITEFVDSFVPKNLPKKRIALLKDELTCHILDKRDYYMQIGYDEAVSVDKAIADFGTDEESKNFIYGEFEKLYSERSIYGIIAFLVIAVMNFLCFVPFNIWVTSADFNKDPDPPGTLISFVMIFIVLLMISFARIKKYRKTLISIGIANTVIACSLLMNFYPQMAAYTIGDNLMYLLDRFTPISIGGTIVMAEYSGIIYVVSLWSIFMIPTVYCFVEAVRIKRGTAKAVNYPKKKVGIFSISFLALSVISCLLLPVSQNYIDHYPVWLDCFNNCITPETSQRFDEISIGAAYADVCEYLKNNGYVSVDSYEESLDRLSKKQYICNLKRFNFAEGYEIWFAPQKHTYGNGIVGLKQKDGIVTAKGVGNMEERMYVEKYGSFGYYGSENSCNISATIEYFRSLSKGELETEVMSKFGREFGVIYTKRISSENGETKSYYRVLCRGADPESDTYGFGETVRYVELMFKNGKLSEGIMYDEVTNPDGENTIETETIN